MLPYQPGILAPVPREARYLFFQLVPDASPRRALDALAAMTAGDDAVVGVGPATVSRLGARIAGLREPDALEGRGVGVPATPAALFVWLRGDDRGVLLHRGRAIIDTVADAFALEQSIDAFRYDTGRDLTGYEDGTENPTDEAAVAAAIVSGGAPGMAGGSFVAVQTWRHDLARFERLTPTERDHVFGRRRSDNEEIADAPESAHVKRTAQEDFEPAAFVVRRSMPWADATGEGLVFVSFAVTLDRFEAQLRRMVGLDDGIVDGLFRFTRPLGTSYFFCPPIRDGKLDLRALTPT